MEKKIKEFRNSLVDILRLIWWGFKMIWQISPKYVAGYMVSSLLQVLTEIAQLWVAALVIAKLGTIIMTQSDPGGLYQLVFVSVVLICVDKILWTFLQYFERQIYIVGSADIYMRVNKQFASMSIAQANNTDIRQLADRLTSEGYSWKPLNFSFYILYGLHGSARLVGASFLLMTQMPILVLLLVISTLPVLYIQRRSGDQGWGIWGEIGDRSRIFWGISYILQSREALEEIKPQRSADYLLGKASAVIGQYVDRASAVIRKFFKLSVVGSIFEIAVSGMGYFWLVTRAVAGKMSFDNFVFMSSLLWQTLSSIRQVVAGFADILQLGPFISDYIKFIELKNDQPMVSKPVKIEADSLKIEFRDVSFKYPGSENEVLKNVSFTINPGDQIAIVGSNGSGKTTIIRLLLRFYDPTNGEILVNGTNLREIDIDSYYEHIGTLFQVFNKYPLGFKDNIVVSERPNEAKYQEALNISDGGSVLKKLTSDKVYLRPDFKNGVDLSGGEWQKVAIARNLYAGGSLFILDEPTSSIDSLSEQKIFNKLYKELQDKTLITISHRFNTVKKASKIIVVKSGRIVETGTHDSLVHANGVYREMYDAQAKNFR